MVTPESAGWSFVGLRVVELAAGEARSIETGADELIVLPLAGSVEVEVAPDGPVFSLAGRADVFCGPSDFAYLPPGCRSRLYSAGGGRFALPRARTGEPKLPPGYGPAESVPVEVRGAGAATRQLNNFCAPGTFPAEKLMAVECITPAGNWSSWPPHKHDTAGEGEAILEELYYFEVAATSSPRVMGDGFAVHRVYTADGDIDLCEEVRQGDVVLVPRGYHGPSVTAPGYDLYYLNVLAGPAPERTMAFCDDPAHHWIRLSWEGQPTDPRVPLAGGSGRFR